MLFYVWEDARVWDHWNQSFHLHSDLGPVSCFHLRTFLMAHPWGVAAVWWWLWQGFFPSWLPSELTSSPSVVALIADDSGILCLLIQQEICHFSKPILLLWTCSCGWKSNFNHALVILFCSNGIPGLSAYLDIKISCSLRMISTTFFNDEHILLIYIQLLAIGASESDENFLNLLP